MESRPRYLDLVMAAFITILITSNIASSAKIIDWGVSLAGLRLAFDGGTLLFPVSYIFGDVLTEVYGYHRSRRVIWTGFGALALCAAVLGLVRIMPGEAGWVSAGGPAAFAMALGGMSSGGIVAASLVAYGAGEFSNAFVLAKMKIWTGGRWLWTRTIGSTLVGEAVDTALFVTVASALGVFPWSLFLTLTVSNYLFKVAIEAVMTPVTYRVVRALKKRERVDWYDRETNFNPFAVRD